MRRRSKYENQVLLMYDKLIRKYPEIINEDMYGTIPDETGLIEFIRSAISENDALRERVSTYHVTIAVTQGKHGYYVNAIDVSMAESVAIDMFNRDMSTGTYSLINIEIKKIESRMPVS